MDKEEIIRQVRQLDPEELRRLSLFLDQVARDLAGPVRPEQIPGRHGSRIENQKRDKGPDHPDPGSEK